LDEEDDDDEEEERRKSGEGKPCRACKKARSNSVSET
jgi:hypothetical protein